MLHPSCLAEEDLLKACLVRSDRRSGPGGQHRNKVETAIVVLHQPTGISAEASERRSQVDNRRVAVWRLRLALATRHRVGQAPPKDATQPSTRWQSRALSGRLSVATEHEDFPALLAELLDRLHSADYSMPNAAEYFGVASSQLVKLLRQWPPALTQVNVARVDRGLHKLT